MNLDKEIIDKVNSALYASPYLFKADTDTRIYTQRVDESGEVVGHEVPIKLTTGSILRIFEVDIENCWIDLPSGSSSYRAFISLSGACSMLPNFEKTLNQAIKDGKDGSYLPDYESKVEDALNDEIEQLAQLEEGSSGAWS